MHWVFPRAWSRRKSKYPVRNNNFVLQIYGVDHQVNENLAISKHMGNLIPCEEVKYVVLCLSTFLIFLSIPYSILSQGCRGHQETKVKDVGATFTEACSCLLNFTLKEHH